MGDRGGTAELLGTNKGAQWPGNEVHGQISWSIDMS